MIDKENELDRAFGPEAEAKGSRQSEEANAMVRAQAKGDQAYKYLIESQEKSHLMEFLMRTIFDNREELIIFIDYVSWCDDFGISLENARRYVAARPAVDGLGRKQLVEAINTLRWLEEKGKGKGDGDKPRKLPE